MFFVELIGEFEIQLLNVDIYSLQTEFVPKVEQTLKKTQEVIISRIKINFNIIEFTDGIYILNQNKFISNKKINLSYIGDIGTLKHYNKTYKNLTVPEVWKNAIKNTIKDNKKTKDFFSYFGSIFNKKSDLLGKQKTMYIVGDSSTGKTTLAAKPIYYFYGKDNVGLISTSTAFAFENIQNKEVIICDEAHHFIFNKGQLLKLLEKDNPVLIERKHKEAIAVDNLMMVFMSNKEIVFNENETQEALTNRFSVVGFKNQLSENPKNYEALVQDIKENEINIVIYCNKLFFKQYVHKGKIAKLRNVKALNILQKET